MELQYRFRIMVIYLKLLNSNPARRVVLVAFSANEDCRFALIASYSFAAEVAAVPAFFLNVFVE